MDDKKTSDGLRKLQRAEDAKKAMAEYHAAAAAVDANTERLRALRLAKEAEEAAKVPPKVVKRKAAKPKPGEKKAGSPSLAQWLKERDSSGHRS